MFSALFEYLNTREERDLTTFYEKKNRIIFFWHKSPKITNNKWGKLLLLVVCGTTIQTNK
jgi:hypothetical protein